VTRAAGGKTHPWHCLRCGRPVQRVLWLVDLRRHVHAARGQPGPEGTPSCCGGEVVHPEDAGARPPQPGDVVLCMPSWGSLAMHLVRLGRVADVGNASWSGTALCGQTYRSRYWVVVQRSVEPQERCRDCEERAQRAGGSGGEGP